MFFIYQTIILIIIFFSPVIIIYRIIKNKEDKKRFKEKFCFFSKKKTGKKLVWFHGSSVGELMSIIPIINYYEKNNYFDQILITSSTLSSSKILQKFNFKKVIHQFYPIDFVFFSKKFLNYWKPNLIIFLESEIWPSMFLKIKKKKLPLILLNARISKSTFQRWNKVKKFSKSVFDNIHYAYPQNKETKIFLQKLGLKKIKFLGNLKFIENKDDKQDKMNRTLYKELKNRKIFVAASTHNREEIFAAQTHILLKKKDKKTLTVIIPRHVDRTKDISSEIEKLNLKIAYHSLKRQNLRNIDIYIVDTFGESKKFYKLAKRVFLGGSIVNKGGQNPLEPARYGAKIFHGPYIDNFRDVYDFLGQMKVSKKILKPVEIVNSSINKDNTTKISKIKNLGNKIFINTVKELDKIIHNEF